MPINIEIVNPLTNSNWNEMILGSEQSSFFHSAEWTKVLSESYGYEPIYFLAIEENAPSFLLPMMEISSFITGRRGVSLPFTDYCYPIIKNGFQTDSVMSLILDIAKKRNWKTIELRGQSKLIHSDIHSAFFYNHILELSDKEDVLRGKLSKSTKRNIRKAEREHIEVSFGTYLKNVEDYYQLHCLTRKKHGLPPQPFAFFKKISDHVITQGKGFVISATLAERTIASAIFFHSGNKAIYKYGASDMKYQSFRPNNMIMWEAIKYYGLNGFKSLCFGRTDEDQDGLRRFKSGWGSEERQLYYYKYDLQSESYESVSDGVSSITKSAFNVMPIFMSKVIGKILYKHVG